MNFNPKLAKTLSVLAVSALATSAHAVGLFQEFTVDEGSVPGALPNVFVADKVTGSYNEKFSIKPDSSFSTFAYADFQGYLKNDGATAIVSQLGSFGANGYGQYAVFTSTGSVVGGQFVGTTGSFEIYIDPNQDTTKALGLTGFDPIALGNTADDYMIASTASPTSLVGLPGTPGAFDFWFKDFVLTAAPGGEAYWPQPSPFHTVIRTNGDFDQFPVVPGPGDYTVTGDVSYVFQQVPEPASLTLLGLGLLGLGVRRRRNT
jgi:hypothetical protein